MSDIVRWRMPGKSAPRPQYFDIDRNRNGVLVSIPSRKTPFALPADYRAHDDLELDYSGVIDIKIARPAKPERKPSSQDKEQAAPGAHASGGWSMAFRDWDVWDYTVGLGLLLLIIGLVVPIFSNHRELAIFAPLGAAAVGLGAFRARQRNNASA